MNCLRMRGHLSELKYTLSFVVALSVKNDKLEVLNEAAAIVPNSSSKCKCTQLLFWGSLSRYIKAEVCNKLRRSSWKLQ